jgi:1-acyl-sn-glycerol-3-phosphate acyltransferase
MNLRAALRIAALLLLFIVCAPVHVATRLLLRRSPWPKWFLAAAAWIIGARVRLEGAPLRDHTLLLANHTSWLDILLLGGSLGSAFVSKDDLGHSLIHWLADQNGTIYVDRTHLKGAKEQAQAVARGLERKQPVTVFPEGTTGPGTHLLPFRSALLEAANYAGGDIEIRPVAIDYGSSRAEFGWFGDEPGKENVLRLLGRAGTVALKVSLLPPLDRGADRKQMTHIAREVIARRLDLTSPPHSPIGEEK